MRISRGRAIDGARRKAESHLIADERGFETQTTIYAWTPGVSSRIN